jgi:hypothetical protein
LVRIFISFSGPTGHRLAVTIHNWLPRVTSAELYLSSRNLTPGRIWIEQLAQELRTTDHAILCLTRDNLRSGWVHFEAGAAFKGLGESRVVPYMLDVDPKHLPEPIRFFQSAPASRAGTLQLLQSLGLPVVREDFDRAWPELERELRRLVRTSRIRRYGLAIALLLLAVALLGYKQYSESASIFPQFEPARELPNYANAAPLQVERVSCEDCPRGFKHTLDAALSGGYATRFLNRWTTIDLQGKHVLLSVWFRKGRQVLEIGLTDHAGNAVFYDCRSDSKVADFAVPLHPDELLAANCRVNVASIKYFSIGYAAAAGKGDHGSDLLDLRLVSDERVPTATTCELRRCAD